MFKGSCAISYFANTSLSFNSCSCAPPTPLAFFPFLKPLTVSDHYLVEQKKAKCTGLPPIFFCALGDHRWGLHRGGGGETGFPWVAKLSSLHCLSLRTPSCSSLQMLCYQEPLPKDPWLCTILFLTQTSCFSACSVSCWCSKTKPECLSRCTRSQDYLNCVPQSYWWKCSVFQTSPFWTAIWDIHIDR